MTDTRVIRAVIYLRLSDLRLTDLKEGETIEQYLKRREVKLREFAKQLSYGDTKWEIIKVIRENDAIAKTSKGGKMRMASATRKRWVTLPDGTKEKRVFRPGFASILKDFKDGTANGLLAETLDRVAREPRDMEDLIDIAKAHKINARVLSGNLTFTNGGTPPEQYMARGMVNHAKMSADDTAWRVEQGRERKALSGEFGGGMRPFGWEPDGVTARPEEFKILRSYSIRALQSLTMAELATELRQGDVPTVTGAEWCAEILTAYLIRPRNAGYVVRHGEILDGVTGIWDAPIEPERWKALHRLLTDPSRKCNQGGSAPRWQGTGVYECGICNDGTSVRVITGKTEPYIRKDGTHAPPKSERRAPRYRCRSNKHYWARDIQHVDAIVEDWIVDRFSQRDAITVFAKPKADVDIAALQSERSNIQADLKVMGRERLQRKITAEQMRDATEWGTARINEIDEILREALDVDSPVVELLKAVDVRATWDAFPLATKQAIIRAVARVRILPAPQQRGRGFDPESVEIIPVIGLATEVQQAA